MLIEAVDREGLALGALVHGVPASLAYLREPANRIDWTPFAQMHDNLQSMLGRDLDAVEQVGHRLVHVPAYGFLRRVAQHVVSARQLYYAGWGWVAPALFNHLHIDWQDRGDRRVLLTCELPPGYRECAPFFHLCRGALAALPQLANLPQARVDGRITGRRAELTITLPESPKLLERVRRRARAMFGAGELLKQVDAQGEALNESHAMVRRARHELREILERLPDGVLVHRDGRILWVNTSLARLLGFETADGIVGRSATALVYPADLPLISAVLGARAGVPPRVSEVRFVRADGRIVTCALEPSKEVEFDGVAARMVLGRDVTGERRLEEQLRVADRMASLGTIAAGVAHEINNPLAYIHTSLLVVDSALRRRDDEALARAVEAVGLAREGVERVRGIVADLKSFSRGDEDTLGPVDVEELLEATLSLSATHVAKRVTIERDYGRVGPVRANRARLGQVFLNLLVNAADAVSEESAHAAPGNDRAQLPRIRVRTRADGRGGIVTEISDTGIGMPDDVAGRVFEPFFTTKPMGTGTGLGLAICHRIVTQLGGQIEAESHLVAANDAAYRTTFRVTLPSVNAATR